jgi:prophage regulatory protein
MVSNILRLPTVIAARGKCRSGHYADVSKGLYTRPVKIGARASGWPESEVLALQSATIAGKAPDEIRTLVRDLEAQRGTR